MDACPERESLCPHAIAHAQNDLFAAVANLFVARLGGNLRRKASLDRKRGALRKIYGLFFHQAARVSRRCAPTRNACAAMVRAGFNAADDGKKPASTT